MTADDGVRCDRHVGEVFPPRCGDCDRERLEALAESAPAAPLPWERATLDVVSEAVGASGMTTAELAVASSIAHDLLVRQLAGDREFTIGELWSVARALDRDIKSWVTAIGERAHALASVV